MLASRINCNTNVTLQIGTSTCRGGELSLDIFNGFVNCLVSSEEDYGG